MSHGVTSAIATALTAKSGYTMGFLAQLNFDSLISDSSISWEVENNPETWSTILFETSLDNGATWSLVYPNGSAIPGLEVGKEYHGKELLVRQSFVFPPNTAPPKLRSLTIYIEWDAGMSDLTVIEGVGGTAFVSPGQAGYDPETHGTYLGTNAEEVYVRPTPLPVLEFTPARRVEVSVGDDFLAPAPLLPAEDPEEGGIWTPAEELGATVELLRVVVADPTADANVHPLCSFTGWAGGNGPYAYYLGNDLYCRFALYSGAVFAGARTGKVTGAVQPNVAFDLAMIHQVVTQNSGETGFPDKPYGGSNGIVYVNGRERARAPNWPHAFDGDNTFYLGYRLDSSYGLLAGDRIGEVRLWNRALTGSDILRRRTRRLTTAEKALVSLKLLWEFDEAEGRTLTDRSASGKNGTIYAADGNPWRIVRGLVGRIGGIYDVTPYRISPPISLDLEGANVLRAATTPKGLNVSWNGQTFLGLGELGSIGPVREPAELESAGLEFSLSGVNSANVSLAFNEHYLDRPCYLWLAWWDTDLGTLLVDPILLFKGRMDEMPIAVDAETARVGIRAENELINWERITVRRWNDEDQQRLFPGDRGFGKLAETNTRTIYWPTQTIDFEPGQG